MRIFTSLSCLLVIGAVFWTSGVEANKKAVYRKESNSQCLKCYYKVPKQTCPEDKRVTPLLASVDVLKSQLKSLKTNTQQIVETAVRARLSSAIKEIRQLKTNNEVLQARTKTLMTVVKDTMNGWTGLVKKDSDNQKKDLKTTIVKAKDQKSYLGYRTYKCAKQSIVKQGKYLVLDATVGNWARDGFCRAVSTNQIQGNKYQLQGQLYNYKGWKGINSGFPGLLFNAKDSANFDFVYFRIHSTTKCYQTGYVKDGKPIFTGAKTGRCSGGTLKGRTWFTVTVEVNGRDAKLLLDGKKLVTFRTKYDAGGVYGPLAASGFKNIVYFKDLAAKTIKKKVAQKVTASVTLGNKLKDRKTLDRAGIWTMVDFVNKIKRSGTVTSASFYAKNTKPLRIGLYKPVSGTKMRLVAQKEVTPKVGINKIALRGFKAEKGFMMGFTWINYGVIPFDNSKTQNYYEYPSKQNVGKDVPLVANRYGNRVYSFSYTLA